MSHGISLKTLWDICASLKRHCLIGRILAIKNTLNLKMKPLAHGTTTECMAQEQHTISFIDTK